MSGSPALRRLNLVRISHHVPLDDDADEEDTRHNLHGSPRPAIRRFGAGVQSIGRQVTNKQSNQDLDKRGQHNWESEDDDVTTTISHHVPDEVRRGSYLGSRFRWRNFSQAPEFVKRLNAFEEAEAGSTVTFECQFRAFPKPAIKWYKDDEEVTEDESYVVEEDNDGVVRLVLEHVYKADEGAYKCKAENTEGVASTTGYLSVKGDIGDRPLSSQDRGDHEDRCVSFPPHLRTIIEQKSIEEREEEEVENQGRSPIQDFIDNIEYFKKSKTWPFLGELEKSERVRDDDEYSSGSATSVDSQHDDLVTFIARHEGTNAQLLCNELINTNLEVSLHTTPNTEIVLTSNGNVPSLQDQPSQQCVHTNRKRAEMRDITFTELGHQLTCSVGDFIDILQFPVLYYFGFSVLAGLAGVITQCPVLIFVGFIAAVVLASFRYLLSDS